MKKAILTGFALLSLSTALFAGYPVSAYINSSSGPELYNTGVLVNAGSYLSIQSDYNDTWSLGAYDREGNADGLGNPFGGNYGTWTQDGKTFLYGAMVGRIGSGDYFLVGSNFNQVVSETGNLYLGCWDSNYGDNSGEINATVENLNQLIVGAPLPSVIPMFLGGLGVLGFRRKK
jgi:hypothetical protein